MPKLYLHTAPIDHHAVIPLYFKNHEHFPGCSENDSRDALSPWEMFCTGKGITCGNVHWTFPRVTELCAVSFRHPGKGLLWKSHGTVTYGLIHPQKYIWNMVYDLSSALTYTYTWWLCIWFKSSAQVHMKHAMSMQMTYIICTNIYLHMVTVHMV
jgi:hypothetical protein